MKKKFLLIFIIIAVWMVTFGAMSTSASVNGTCGDNVAWTYDGGTLTISGHGHMDSWYSSNTPWYSFATDIVKVTIEDGVINIGYGAFEKCYNLSDITIPDSVTEVDGRAFLDTAYYNNSSNWENNVLYIGKHLIDAKTTISGSYKINDNTITIAAFAFEECSKLTSIDIPNSVKTIDGYAFYGCSSLTSVTIPDGVTTIGDKAFRDCIKLSNISVPDSITWICGAFYNTAYYNNTSNWENGVLYIGNHLVEAKTTISGNCKIRDNTITISVGAFQGCDRLTSVYLPNSINSINDWAFSLCKNLKSINIPDNVTAIGAAVFYGCSSLTSITIPDGVTDIGYWTYMDCTNLADITIGNNVTFIDDGAFDGCINLKNVYYRGTKDEWNKITINSDNADLTNATIHYVYFACTKTTISNNGKTFTVTPINIENGKTVILALYNGDRFVEMQSSVYTGETIPFTTTKAYTNVKVFVWNDLKTLNPVCEAEIVK